MTKYDEPGPHWCDCTRDGKWKDSTLSSPIYHHAEDFVNWHTDTAQCQCHGATKAGREQGYTYTPYCTLL